MLEFLKVIAVLGLIAWSVWRIFKAGEVKASIIAQGVLAVIASFILLSSFGTIGAGERGVVLRFGAVTGRIVDPGLYVITPVIESVHAMNVQVQKEEVTADAVSKDLQQVNTAVALNYYPLPSAVANLYKTVGADYKVRIIDPAIQEAVKSVTAKFNADSLVAHRHKVKDQLEEEVKRRLASHDIVMDAVNITNFAFSKEFTHAIEEKVTATQQALKAENDLKRIQFEADQKVATATAEAEAIRIKAQAITQQGGKDYVSLMAIEKWNGTVPTWISGSGVSPIPFIDVTPGK